MGVQARSQLSRSEQECQRLQRQVAQLQETLEQREFELNSRPTHRYTQQLKNRISKLEGELHPERDLVRKNIDTRELIRRDKRKRSIERQRQSKGLEPLSEVPRDDLERLVLSTCSSLRVTRLGDVERLVQEIA